jgi:Phage integrase family
VTTTPSQGSLLTERRAAPSEPGETSRPSGEGGTDMSARFPARPVALSWPATQTARDTVLSRLLSSPFALDHPVSQQKRRQGLLTMMNWLEAQPGNTWQDRWLASRAEDESDWRRLVAPWRTGRTTAGGAEPTAAHIVPALGILICGDVIRPRLEWLLSSRWAPRTLAVEMARTRDATVFAELAAACEAGSVGTQTRQTALNRIAFIMAAKGGLVADVTVGDCVELLALTPQGGTRGDGHVRSSLFYQLLLSHGVFGQQAPTALRVLSGRGQLTPEQLIDRYQITCGPVRDVLVDYLRERQLTADFSSLQRLAYLLGKLFWADIETHAPGVDSLRLPRDVAASWKQRVMTRTVTTKTHDGRTVETIQARLDGRSVLTAVRSFYLDLAEWADDDPARWGPWVARCPVSASEASHKKDRTRRKSRTDQRTRERLPVLPALAAWADTGRKTAAATLEAARSTAPGELFTIGGVTLRRTVMKTGTTTGRIWAEDPSSGSRRDLIFEEHRAFWTCAAVDVLRLTGIRIEELTELSHHSLIQYRLPATGELIPLLQIAPSKTDTERLLVISPELADVLSAIIRRIRSTDGTVPLVVSYDAGERVYNPPTPLLFQRPWRLEQRPVTQTCLREYLDHALTAIGAKDASGDPLRYTFHDFRRIFITDAIMHGMPPHIAQLVAGHKDINTTMGYKAVYPEEVINGHRAFIARRRGLRPAAEYRTPTDQEWEEFLGHFERRKLSLGTCGRSYDTPCIHEHSCIRCPLLRPDPAQHGKLTEIRDNLHLRIDEALQHGWLGKAEGLKVSLAAAEQKLAQMDEIATRRASPVHLGIPRFSEIAAHTTAATAKDPS